MNCDCCDGKTCDQPQDAAGRQTRFFHKNASIPTWLLGAVLLLAANMVRLSFS